MFSKILIFILLSICIDKLIPPASSQTSPFPTIATSQTSPFPTTVSSQTSPFPTTASSQTSPFPTTASSQTSPFPTIASSQTSPFPTIPPAVNIARGKPVFQSSLLPRIPMYINGSGSPAVDGILDSNFYSGRLMFHTYDGPGGPNWLVVDLQSTYKVLKTLVYNRMDCCSERESYLIIGLLNSFTKGQTIERGSYPLCGIFPNRAILISLLVIPCALNAPASRYVVVQSPANATGPLNIAEVEVYGNNTGIVNPDSGVQGAINIALGKKVYFSSIDYQNSLFGTNRQQLTDGNGASLEKYCVFTNRDINNWIAVDLGSYYKIKKVVIYAGNNTANYLSNVIIYLLSSPISPFRNTNLDSASRCGITPSYVSGRMIIETNCDYESPKSRYVVLKKPNKEQFGLCELEVFAYPAVNGNWGNWNEWSFPTLKCSSALSFVDYFRLCTSEATQTRMRLCNNPEPNINGVPCEGDAKETAYLSNLSMCQARPKK